MTPGRCHRWLQGHTLNKRGRGLLGGTTYLISRLLVMWFHIFSIQPVLKCEPWGGAMFGPRSII